ncbi:MAG: DUF998 domain-containing protein [Actinomycetota bacterium]|nr:DUF998 domain-containing protein [Actinomycetota bacterium]
MTSATAGARRAWVRGRGFVTLGRRGRASASIRLAGASAALIAAPAYSSFLLGGWLLPPAERGSAFISELEVSSRPYSWLFRLCDVVAGVAIIAAAVVLYRVLAGYRRAGAAVTAVAVLGMTSVVDGTTTMACLPSVDPRCAAAEHNASGLVGQLIAVHTDSGVLGFLAAAAAAVLLGFLLIPTVPVAGRLSLIVGLLLASSGLADVALLLRSADIADVERVRTVLTSVWLASLPVVMLTAVDPPGDAA